MFHADISHDSTRRRVKVYISQEGSGYLLSFQTAEDLNPIQFTFFVHAHDLYHLLQDFAPLFDGIGCLVGPAIQLHIHESVAPVGLRHRRIAFHLCPKVEAELKLLEIAGIIEHVRCHTPWVSPHRGDEKAQTNRHSPPLCGHEGPLPGD